MGEETTPFIQHNIIQNHIEIIFSKFIITVKKIKKALKNYSYQNIFLFGANYYFSEVYNLHLTFSFSSSNFRDQFAMFDKFVQLGIFYSFVRSSQTNSNYAVNEANSKQNIFNFYFYHLSKCCTLSFVQYKCFSRISNNDLLLQGNIICIHIHIFIFP